MLQMTNNQDFIYSCPVENFKFQKMIGRQEAAPDRVSRVPDKSPAGNM